MRESIRDIAVFIILRAYCLLATKIIGHVEAGDYTVVTKRGQLLIGGLKDGDTVQVTDLAGRTVYSGEESTIYVTRGSYIVRIGHWMKKVLTK